MTARKYDPLHDAFYHLDATPELYLDDYQILSVAHSIGMPETEEETSVFKLIRMTEGFKRLQLLGQISKKDCVDKCTFLDDQFRKKYGYWAYASVFYIRFYETLGYASC